MGAGSDAAWSVLGLAAAVITLYHMTYILERMEEQRQAEQERLAREQRAEEERLALEAGLERKRKQREEFGRRHAAIKKEFKGHAARVARDFLATRESCDQVLAQLWQQLRQSSPQSCEQQLRLVEDMQKHATSKERLYEWLSQHAQKAMDSSPAFPSIPDRGQLWLYYHPDEQAGTSLEWQILCLEMSKAAQALWWQQIVEKGRLYALRVH